jgi:hypothetical protein
LLAAGLTPTTSTGGYEREAQSDIAALQRLAVGILDPGAPAGYERVGQIDVAALRRRLLVGGVTTGYSLSGPSTGPAGTPSSDFTVALLPSGSTYQGADAVIHLHSDAGGTFTPVQLVIFSGDNRATPTTFKYTPASTGAKTISTTNDGGLSDPPSLIYTATFAGLNDGDPVSSWPDSSGNGHNATQTGSARPTFKTNIVNGKPIVRFTSAGLSGLNLATTIPGNTAFTCITVQKIAASGSAQISLAATDAAPFGVIQTSGDTFASDRAGYLHTSNEYLGFHIFIATLDGSGGGTIYGDGTVIGGPAGANSGTGDFGFIGYRPSPAAYSNGDIAEILFCNAGLTATDRQNAEKTLGTKYGISVPFGTVIDLATLPGLQGWWKADSGLS